MKKNESAVISICLGILSLVFDINLFVTSFFSGKLIFLSLLEILDYINIFAFTATWFIAGLGIIAGVDGLKDERKKIAKWGIGLSAAGLVIYFLLILSLYARFGMI